MQPLDREFFHRDTAEVAQDLLGCLLVREVDGHRYVARVVETEAYVGPHDLACHAARGVTPRTEVMYGKPGIAYVFFIYGLHYLLNVVTETEGHGSAVLFRGVEPLEGFPPGAKTDGPAKLTKAMGIGKEWNRWDLTLGSELWLAAGEPVETIAVGTRIGVDYAGDWAHEHLRYWVPGSRWVSRPRPKEPTVLQRPSTRGSRKGS